MTTLVQRNRAFLTDLFAGPFPGHGVIMSPEWPANALGDFTTSARPVADWVPWAVTTYRKQLENHERFHDDSVPYVNLNTNTGIFAAAFGCRLHVYDEPTNACALPHVDSPADADRLPEPSLDAPTLARIFELARLVRRELGPDVPISVPDIQSPFDIAALIWRKESLLLAMYDAPESVKRLVDMCLRLLKKFLVEFRRELGEVNYCHCPIAWAPPDLGCWLSEDEAGTVSVEMFDEFCLPPLVELSRTFGGLFMHCCATADHQYGEFRKIPQLRGLNRVFQAPGPKPAIDAFSGHTVFVQSWCPVDFYAEMLAMARPDSRFLFNLGPLPPADADAAYARLRGLCGRT